MGLNTLVATTNTILRLDHPTLGDLLNACMVGCRELQMLSDDEAFFAQVQRASARPRSTREDISRVFDDLGLFHALLEAEARAL